MQKNEEKIGIVKDFGTSGEGIIKDETVVFVPFCLKGEKVKYKVLKATSKCAYGKLVEVIEKSSDRREPTCPVFYKCGGCHLQHVKYAKQLEIKKTNIKNCFSKIANLNVEVNDAVVGDSEFRYRNKLQLPVGEINGQTVIGFYAENSHRIIPIKDCLINAEWTKDLISAFNEYIEKYKIFGYNETTGQGDIREITAKEIKGNIIITVVSLKPTLKNSNELIDILKRHVGGTFSLYLNVNNTPTNVIYGKDFKLIYGEPEYTAKMLDITYKIGVMSFMQVNTCVCEKLYSAVLNSCKIDKDTTVIDAYSGAGLMTALLSKNAKKAIGIEVIKEAVDCANDLAKLNNLSDKITNYCGKCEDILPSVIETEKKNGSKTCLVLDPPRKGCDINVINAVINSGIDRIVYVSCLPSSLARDVGLITGSLEVVNGEIKRKDTPSLRYEIESVTPFDMFANTKHVETLCVLKKRA